MESTPMPILLQKHLLSFWSLFPRLLGVVKVLLYSLFLRHSSLSLDLLTFLFAGNLGFLVAFDSCKFSKPPSIELAQRINTVSIVNVDYFLFVLFYKDIRSTSSTDTKPSHTLEELPSDIFSNQIVTLFLPFFCFFLFPSGGLFRVLSQDLFFRHGDTASPTK